MRTKKKWNELYYNTGVDQYKIKVSRNSECQMEFNATCHACDMYLQVGECEWDATQGGYCFVVQTSFVL